METELSDSSRIRAKMTRLLGRKKSSAWMRTAACKKIESSRRMLPRTACSASRLYGSAPSLKAGLRFAKVCSPADIGSHYTQTELTNKRRKRSASVLSQGAQRVKVFLTARDCLQREDRGYSCSCTTWTVTVAVTSRCRRTGTENSPSCFSGSSRTILRRSIS